VCLSLLLTNTRAVSDPEAGPKAVNSLFTQQALGAPHPLHPLTHPHPLVHPLSINGIAAASAAAGRPLGPLFPGPASLHPSTFRTKVPLGACTVVCSLLDLIVFNPDFSTLVSLIKTTDLVELLSQPGPITMFAPTNLAFDAMPLATLQALLTDKVALQSILLRHLTKGALFTFDFPPGPTPLITGAGERVTVTAFPNHVTLTSVLSVASIIDGDNIASNGVVHVVDNVF